MRERVEYTIGSVLSIVGAFAIGAILHRVFVQQSLTVTEPTAVLGIVAGLVVIAVGQRIEQRTGMENAATPDREESDEAESFDEELAPIDESSLEQYERDEEYDQ